MKTSILGLSILVVSLAGVGHGLYQSHQIEQRWLNHSLELQAEKFSHLATAYAQLAEPNVTAGLTQLMQKASALDWGVQIRCYSPYALDWRNQFETPFNTKAWKAIELNPKYILGEMTANQNGITYRLAQGIFLASNCQNCTFLNSQGETVTLTPGQLLGVLEWEWPLGAIQTAYQAELAAWRRHQWQQSGMLFALGIFSILGLVIAVRSIRTDYENKYKEFSREVNKQQDALTIERQQHAEDTQFTRVISREIRTPINSLLGLSELLLAEESSSTSRHYEKLKLLEESAKEIVGILDNITELRKIESDDTPLYLTKTVLRDLVNTLLTQFSSKAAQKQLMLLCRVDKKVPDQVLLDGHLIQQILNNLLHNAMQNTQRGGIAIEITAVDPAPNLIQLFFKVIDTSAGIPVSKLPYVFKQKQEEGMLVFSDEEQLRSRLIVCEKLVNKMGGTIGVNSELDNGSIFWFTLEVPNPSGVSLQSKMQTDTTEYSPYAYDLESPMDSKRLMKLIQQRAQQQTQPYAPQKNAALQASSPEEALSILLVEDNAVNRMVATNILNKMGHRVQVAGNGLEALQQVIDQDFDLVFMDIQMPEMNGVAATQEIRKLPEPKKSQIPIIALTADAMVGDKEKYLRAGLDGYVSKPFRVEQLRQVIESLSVLRA